MTSSAISATNPTWDPTQDLSFLIDDLRKSKIVEVEPMKNHLEGLGKTARFKGTVNAAVMETSDNRQIKVSLKSYLSKDGVRSCYPSAEETAYSLNQYLFFKGTNRNYIPPTVAREFGSTTVSVSYFVESPLNLWNKEHLKEARRSLARDDFANAQALISILPHTDPHPGNWIAAQGNNNKTHPVIIDTETLADLTLPPTRYNERSWSLCAFSDQISADRSTLRHFVHFDPLELRRSLLQDFHHLTNQSFDTFYKHLRRSSFSNRQVLIYNKSLWVRYFQDDPFAFPNAPDQLPQETIDAYKTLATPSALLDVYRPLTQTQNTTFDMTNIPYYIYGTIQRIQTMLDHVTPMERGFEPTSASS